MNKLIHKAIRSLERKLLSDTQFAIISDNCWGYELYQTLGRAYNTPFVGLFIMPDCYMKLLGNLTYYLNSELSFVDNSKYSLNIGKTYPIGLLDGEVEIHFLHYSNKDEARSKWARRTQRLLNDIDKGVPLFFKFSTDCSDTNKYLIQFHALPFRNKLSLSLTPFDSPHHAYVPFLADKGGSHLVHGRRLYRKRCHYFDIALWLKTSTVRQTSLCKFFSLIS